ncbi:MAG: DUF6880 family protein [Planctomycetota bacterium]
MSNRKRKPIDPLETAIELALRPGSFISYNASWSFVREAGEVADNIEKVIKKQPERAAHLFEIFIAACHEKAEEIDDSGGNFGMLVDDFFCGWIKARQTAGADPDETAKRLLAWMEDDPYGFCHDLEREAVKVLDTRGLDAMSAQVRSKFEAALVDNEKTEQPPSYARRRWGGVLKTLLAARGKIDAYIALCERTDLGMKECRVIAEMYRTRRRPKDALAWIERGLKTSQTDGRESFGAHELRDMKRTLQAKLGRSQDALESAWSEFEAHPSTVTYQELMRYVPAKEKRAWREKAMKASEKGDLDSQIELWRRQKETARILARLGRATDKELESLGHYRAEKTARTIERSHPGIAARMYRAQCMRVVNAGKSKYYGEALEYIERAGKCYAEAGLDEDWEAVVADVRARHARKKGFMVEFDKIVSGALKSPRFVS